EHRRRRAARAHRPRFRRQVERGQGRGPCEKGDALGTKLRARWAAGSAHRAGARETRMAAETAPHPARDERGAQVGLVAPLLQRPEIGSLFGVVAVFILFTATAGGFSETGFGSLTGAARWSDEASNIGIMAVPVALLMIGGEFDLSAGVMVGSSGLLLGLLVTETGMNIWPAIVIVL